MKKSGGFWKAIHIFKVVWKFLTTEPKERTDEEWEEAFIVGEAIRRARKSSMRRKKSGCICRSYGNKYRKKSYR